MKELNGKSYAVLSNQVVKTSYNLTLVEHRILKQFLCQLDYYNKAITSQDVFSLTVKEFAAQWEVPADNARKSLVSAAKTLYDRVLFQGDLDASFSYARWISSYKYDAEMDNITIRWSQDILEHVSELKERYVKLDLNDLVELQSSYSYRLYEILNVTLGENGYKNPSFSVEDLMFMLDVPRSYRSYNIFKMRVLTPCVKELSETVLKFKNLSVVETNAPRSKKVVSLEFRGCGVGNRYV
jgi:plasmid replication initiation protein